MACAFGLALVAAGSPCGGVWRDALRVGRDVGRLEPSDGHADLRASRLFGRPGPIASAARACPAAVVTLAAAGMDSLEAVEAASARGGRGSRRRIARGDPHRRFLGQTPASAGE